jgi:DNA-binding NarL/FixJ family response regulator
MTAIRLVLCDDHEMVRTALTRVLEMNHRCQVLAAVASAEELLKLMTKPAIEFDVLLLDLNLGSDRLSAGIDLIHQLLTQKPELQIVVVSMHDDPEIISTALQRGARGYVSKASSVDILHEAIRHVHEGRRFLDPALVGSIVARRALPISNVWDAAALTRREREVMVMLCAGQRVSEVATALNLSIKTISTHKVRLMEKLNVKNNADLIKLGMLYSQPYSVQP